MGWVTLTLRKTELKRTHADYQMELLQISREKRQMARQNHYDQLVARNDGQATMRSLYTDYKAQRDAINGQIDDYYGSDVTGEDGEITDSQQREIDNLKGDLDEAQEQYEQNKMEAQQEMEDELARIEEEANDIETSLDQEQVEIEAQLEAISAEMEAVGEAVSSQIQASTIKLS